ncbi:hypothetical protein ACLOJK_037326 [Asimina triloba]
MNEKGAGRGGLSFSNIQRHNHRRHHQQSNTGGMEVKRMDAFDTLTVSRELAYSQMSAGGLMVEIDL